IWPCMRMARLRSILTNSSSRSTINLFIGIGMPAPRLRSAITSIRFDTNSGRRSPAAFRSNMDKPLRVLGIVNLPWDPRLGAVRVWFELSEQWKKSGHKIDKYSLDDAFPKPTRSRALYAWRQAVFPYRAARLVRRNAG